MKPKTLIIVGLIILAIYLIYRFKDSIVKPAPDAKVDLNTVSLNDAQSTINNLQSQLAELTAAASNGDTQATMDAEKINKQIQILKLQQKVNIKFSASTIELLMGFSLYELIGFNAMDTMELATLYNNSFQTGS